MIIIDEAKGLYEDFIDPNKEPEYHIYESGYGGKKTPDNIQPLLTFNQILDDPFSYTNKTLLPSFATIRGKFTNDTLNRGDGFKVTLGFGIKLTGSGSSVSEENQVTAITSKIEELQDSLINLYIPYIPQRYRYDNIHIADYSPIEISATKVNYYFWRIDFQRIRVSSSSPQFIQVEPEKYRKPNYAP